MTDALRRVSLGAVAWWTASAVAMAGLFLVLHVVGVDVLLLTRDATQTLDVGAEVGLLSSAGVALWGAAAAVCAVTALILRTGPRARYLAWTSLFLLALLADDAAVLHDRVLPRLGVDESITYAAYVIVVAAWLTCFRHAILAGDITLLGLAAGSFGVSLVFDHFELAQSFEDYAKLLGIATMLAYAFAEARAALRPATADPGASLAVPREGATRLSDMARGGGAPVADAAPRRSPRAA